MVFVWPTAGVLFFFIPMLAWRYFHRTGKQTRSLERYFPGLARRSHIPFCLFLLAVVFGILGTMRPVVNVTVLAGRILVVFAVDVSGSMSYSDIKPTRLEAAKSMIGDFIDRQDDSVVVGIVAFSDTATLVQPPTHDHDALRDSLERLKPLAGTAVGSAISESLAAVNNYFGNADQPVPAIIVLLTDGQSNSGEPPLAAADEAAERGIKIYTVGIGTKFGNEPLDEGTLQEIAKATNGKYYRAGSEEELRDWVNRIDRKQDWQSRPLEFSFALAGFSLFFLLASLRMGGIL